MQSKLQIVPLITTRKKICSMNCKTFKSIWTLFHLKKSLKEIKDSSVNYQTKEIFIICSIDWKTFYRILTVFFVVVVKKSAKEIENSLAGYQKKEIICLMDCKPSERILTMSIMFYKKCKRNLK